jgi:hypothetical protein
MNGRVNDQMIWHRNITLAEGRNSLAGEQNDIMLWDSRLICLRDRVGQNWKGQKQRRRCQELQSSFKRKKGKKRKVEVLLHRCCVNEFTATAKKTEN